jgi:alpha-D-xyloside xylohydrolase
VKHRYILLIFVILTAACGQKSENHNLLDDRLTIQLDEGELNIIPISDNTIRILLKKGAVKEDKELILVNQLPVPDFKFSESDGKLRLSTKYITVLFNKENSTIEFADNAGKVFLSEKPGSRKMIPDSVMGEPCFIAEQSFDSPENEYLFGLGQFQDGHYELRTVTRKLIQVNSQIAIPFLYSSRGYGILWHQYGLTHFNPADNVIPLTKNETSSDEHREVEVTTTSGTHKVSQRQSLYTGKFTLDKIGEYSIMLDLGDMENRHMLVIDDSLVIDQTNFWLPPAASVLVNLSAGEHSVQVVCKLSNSPRLTWRLSDNTTTFRSPHAKSLDYVVFYGKKADHVIASYRKLSGNAPLFPQWAYGFWQCRERYTSSDHLLETVKDFRSRELPMDVIVQDWQYWSDKSWGVPKFDESRYPNPSGFIKELHDLNAHFAISIWSNPDKNSEIGQAYLERELYIPGTKWLDYFNPETGKSYWNSLNENLFTHGVDAWWMDATEPENDALTGTQTHLGPGDFYRLTYPLFVSKSVYEGQRETDPTKRVCILTRSAFAGQQRYGAFNWSGDIAGTWDGYKRQLVAGLNYSLTGMPYWTTDIGGFFRPGPSQYTDKKFRELLTRWFQWGAFCPIFRIHGFQTETEPWKYGAVVEENMRKMMNLRYRLLPYIYSEAWQITRNGSTMMRPLVMDFQEDMKAADQPFEYMFGQSFLVAPVTEPNVTELPVYLPKATAWYSFWTGKQFSGGQTINASAPIDKIPVFVKAGSIVPVGKFLQYTGQKTADTLEIRIYKGADGRFELYEDEGDNYNYEKGAYSVIPFEWNEQKQALTIGKRQGDFEGLLKERIFNIVWVNESDGKGVDISLSKKSIKYTGLVCTIDYTNQNRK